MDTADNREEKKQLLAQRHALRAKLQLKVDKQVNDIQKIAETVFERTESYPVFYRNLSDQLLH